MANVHLLLKDTKNRLCQYMGFVGQDIDNLLTNNVAEMQNVGIEVLIETLDKHYSSDELSKMGWKSDQGLYDKLLMDYTKIANKMLNRWC